MLQKTTETSLNLPGTSPTPAENSLELPVTPLKPIETPWKVHETSWNALETIGTHRKPPKIFCNIPAINPCNQLRVIRRSCQMLYIIFVTEKLETVTDELDTHTIVGPKSMRTAISCESFLKKLQRHCGSGF